MPAKHTNAGAGRFGAELLLLANRADVNATDEKGRTPLLMGVLLGQKDIADLLRQHGCHE